MKQLRKIEIVGAGPAGLYTAILLRRLMPQIQVRISEKNPPGATFGFGVVFSERALDFLQADDPQTHDLITPWMEYWQDIVLNHPREQLKFDGVGFSAIGRLELIEILVKRARSLGADIRYSRPIETTDNLDADLVVGADGLNSIVRKARQEEFQPKIDHFDNYFAWFGVKRSFETLTQTFIETDRGPFNAHHYRYARDRSTFIVECTGETFDEYRFKDLDETESAQICAEIFEDVLDGNTLVTNNSIWRQFPALCCRQWVAGNCVLIGDAAHTAHFSIGSGTRLAMEDAIALVQALTKYDDLDEALQAYQRERQPIVSKIVEAANTSARWYENFGEKMKLAPLDFGYDYITRSGRMDRERLHQLSPGFMARYEREKGVV